MRESYITGVGRTKFGNLEENLPELAYKAISLCLEDWGNEIGTVDAVVVSNFVGGEQEGHLHLGSLVASFFEDFHKPSFRVEAACASGGVAIFNAVRLLSEYKNVLVVGCEKLSGTDVKKATTNLAMAGDRYLDRSNGIIFPASYALIAQQHMRKFGTTQSDLAAVSIKNHSNANLNDLAHFNNKKVTMKMIENSPIISSPLRLFDCAPLSDGAAAVIVSKKPGKNSVKISGSALATDTISLVQRKDICSFNATAMAAKEALTQANKKISDMDMFEVHDCFTIAELVAMEDLGICRQGESKTLIQNGETALGGSFPINVGGGLKAGGHPIGATGISQVVEIIKHLRGEAGKRQVDGVKACMAQNVGGVGGTVTVHILEKVD